MTGSSHSLASPAYLISLLLQLLLYGIQELEQMQNHLDPCQVDAQVVLQPADAPQLSDLFLAIAQLSAGLFPPRSGPIHVDGESR